MRDLIVRGGLRKTAAPEDGPSFEQQFGILANAVVVDKFPQLDNMRLAFQLIEKDDGNNAVGVVIYLIGKNVVFVPAFFKNSKLIAGDMMFLAGTSQFLPLSDAWISWIKDKDLNDAGELIPQELAENFNNSKGTTIRELADPIVKTASLYLKGLLHSTDDPLKGNDTNLFDSAIGMGKRASAALLGNLIDNRGFLNAALRFYSGDELDSFAKRAALMDEDERADRPCTRLILPLDKQAADLTPDEADELARNGYFIKTFITTNMNGTSKLRAVIKHSDLEGKFITVSGAGNADMLKMDGTVQPVLILREGNLYPGKSSMAIDMPSADLRYGRSRNAAEYMHMGRDTEGNTGLVAVCDGRIEDLPAGAMCIRGSEMAINPEMLGTVGEELTEAIVDIPGGSYLITPDGTAYRWDGYGYTAAGSGNGWTNGSCVLTVSGTEGLVKPLVGSNAVVLPKGTRIVRKKMPSADILNDIEGEQSNTAPVAYVTVSTLPVFLNNYTRRNYEHIKLYSNGNDFEVSGEAGAPVERNLSRKEAALSLVNVHGIEPENVELMLKDASAGASYDNPRAVRYLIQKTAADEASDYAANIPMSEVVNKPPTVEREELPSSLESPERLTQAVQEAAKNGIKEVFDVTAIKLLVRQTQLFDDIQDDLPMFIRVLDSLCKRLFQYYWHTDKMEEKYGLVKIKALEDSLKATLDSLSDLTIFFKQRTVDGSGITGDTGSELM